jgi:hypothetical protein
MRFSRPDVACNASRLGPRSHEQTKAKWMTVLNEDLQRGVRNTNRSCSLQKLSQIGHGTWTHFSFGDPCMDFKIDRSQYGEGEARKRHLARAELSGELWQHPQATQRMLPTPESASQLPKASEPVRCEAPLQPSDVRSSVQGKAEPNISVQPGPLEVVPAPQQERLLQPPQAASTSSQPQERRPPQPRPVERPSPPQLPQLWAAQPRSMTPCSSLAASSRASASVTPSSVAAGQLLKPAIDWSQPGAKLRSRLEGLSSMPPLRRMDSDPGLAKRGYVNPALRLQPDPGSASGSRQGASAADRYSTTFTFG